MRRKRQKEREVWAAEPKRKIRSQQKLMYQLANRATNQPVRMPSACSLCLLRFDVGYRKNLQRIVQELSETIFGAALSRPRRRISSLCRSSFLGPSSLTDLRFPFELSRSHRRLVDAGQSPCCGKTLTSVLASPEERFSRNPRFSRCRNRRRHIVTNRLQIGHQQAFRVVFEGDLLDLWNRGKSAD